MAARPPPPKCTPLARRGTLWVMAMTQSSMELYSESLQNLLPTAAAAVLHCMCSDTVLRGCSVAAETTRLHDVLLQML